MDDLISRQSAIDCVEASPINGWVKEDLIQALETTPSAQPEQNTGEWLANEHDDIPLGLMISCSKCGGEILVNDAVCYDYCPYCGSHNEAVYRATQSTNTYAQGWRDGQEALREEMWERERDRLD